jgi:2-oxo-4-hydroxy-4-carboxy-5-ureidoimidazoline decarboxylase
MERWQRINAAADGKARELLGECCAAARWIDRMCARRPFATRAEALAAAREEWFALSEEEWREAFAHHPRIGDVEALSRKLASAGTLSQREQSAVGTASTDVLAALVQANRAYEERFGYIFIVCATGKSAEEMLAILKARLGNRSEDESRVAAEEHARICDLRLAGE